MKTQILNDFIQSWQINGQINGTSEIIHPNDEILAWINEKNNTTFVEIKLISSDACTDWHIDDADGILKRKAGGFFQISGIQSESHVGDISYQPIILQYEIGFLGIICKKINGIIYFLMQAKIEPGNINCIQISPTIQATFSNFTQVHNGSAPKYLDLFIAAENHHIIVDQIQSEQASRFLGKRNRNICILLDDDTDISISKNHIWMTLGQIKELMRYDNIVNMDTRTVLACLPFSEEFVPDLSESPVNRNDPLIRSIFSFSPYDKTLLHAINDKKMFSGITNELIPLNKLPHWISGNDGIYCDTTANFDIVYCDIKIEGREVRHWQQPMFRSKGKALFGLLCMNRNGTIRFLVQLMSEIGNFDTIELGPSIFRESIDVENPPGDSVTEVFFTSLNRGNGIVHDVILSEEGGRFYQEENRNVIIMIQEEIEAIPKDYFWLDYGEINRLLQINNLVNIQLRNLISLIRLQ
ncbi:dNDP-4-keto-6-deoxy-glucose-2,3- dehydratase [Clostridia bacterium]|nr:dNDP-4-keto-6-deoxy-glucose-2,3- dehydratase [Clostridia bacterium]